MYKIPFNRADIGKNDIELLGESISAGHISGNGPFTKRAEEQITKILGNDRTLLTTSCTHALEMSALLLRLKPGDEVIVPAFTFVSTASAFMLYGAKPVFVDVRQDTLNIDVDQAEAAITPRTRAICVVHYGGVGCEMERLVKLAQDHNLILIEDNAHGLFAKYRGKYLGTFGALATQSFHETKNITCGEGGALVINDASLAERAEILREKGTDRTKFLRGQVDKYTWVDTGSSWVISDLLAAILFGQLCRADDIYTQRMKIWNRYHTELKTWASKHNVALPTVPDGCEHTGHVYHLRFQRGDQRDKFIDHLKQLGIYAVFHYQPLHLSTVGRSLGGRDGQFPVTESAGDCLVRLPLFNALTDDEQTHVIESVKVFDPSN
ncbi:dTDP-4-amino-4,6-dideoxygalactose transaminase [Acidimicrobiaceae bacterium]|nr:dTDP-4-amino-4,6-dideoxygalactose transaminase [Acidimicrobiaceae bacterium]